MTDFYVIVGMGATGFSCAQYLQRSGIAFAVIDTRAQPPQYDAFKQSFPEVPLIVGGLDPAWLAKATHLIVSPGVALYEPAIAEQIQLDKPVWGDIELFAQAVKVPVIAITGTNAKSTVTTLVGEMAAEAGYHVQVGGNLGVPALDLLTRETQTNLYVLELSSFQLETTHSLRPAVATVLNITPDHMDRYPTLADYQEAKLRVYHDAEVAVCNRDDPLTDCKVALRKLFFTLGAPNPNEFGVITEGGNAYLAFGEERLMSVSELPIIGKHNEANALAALAIGRGFGLPWAPMLAVLRRFPGLPHRCQFVRELNDVRWYNDSKGTNVGASLAAIEGLGAAISGKIILIAGGVGKKADFSLLASAAQRYVRHLVLIGEAADDIAQSVGEGVVKSRAATFPEAILQARAHALPGDCVLLSPACASFDMFKHFEHRGEVFMELVNGLE